METILELLTLGFVLVILGIQCRNMLYDLFLAIINLMLLMIAMAAAMYVVIMMHKSFVAPKEVYIATDALTAPQADDKILPILLTIVVSSAIYYFCYRQKKS